MFALPPTFGQTIRLVPHSGIQFIEYEFNVDNVGRLSRRFIERQTDRSEWVGGRPSYRLIPAWNEDPTEGEAEMAARGSDLEYTVSERGALEMFIQKWVPIPMLRLKAGGGDEEQLDTGPTNWVRARLVEAPDRSPDNPVSHRLILAVDTELLERIPNRPYTAPSIDDAQNEHEFRFVYRFRELAWFLGASSDDAHQKNASFQQWVPAWLHQLFHQLKQAQRPNRPVKPADFPYALEHYARYLVFLEYLEKAIKPRNLRLIDTVSRAPAIKPVEVDLILDIGNSRTCGILIESYPDQARVDLNNSVVLQLRDLSAPEHVYAEPFDSHVELSQPNFGPEALSRQSARPLAFLWPSPVRVGPEAARFRELAEGTEALSGLSSPKRYLCDTSAVNQDWRFPSQDYGRDGTPPLIDRAMRRYLNAKGDVIAQLEEDRSRYKISTPEEDLVGTLRLSFSRSSFYTFMVAEMVFQTLSMINSAAFRERRTMKDAPRKLRRVILTLPPAMPVQEQRILRSRAKAAIKLIWRLMGWTGNPPPNLTPPEVQAEWDEASCVQFVYLYGEIAQKLGGSIEGFFDLVGRPRPFAEPDRQPEVNARPEKSLRVASVDIGGGTTDLMITTYYQERNRAIKPVQNFREGFRIAGDDILKVVIEQLVLPPIDRALKEAGHPTPRVLLARCFGGDFANMEAQERHLRRQFVVRILEPIALRILADAESGPAVDKEIVQSRLFEDFFAAPENNHDHRSSLPPTRLTDYLEIPARDEGAVDFALSKCRFETDLAAIRAAVSAVLADIFDLLCEAINELDCDVVLLSGRPSRLPEVISLFVNKLAVTPDRVIPMHAYQAGTWYPFRDRDNRRIGDPKTTTVVGGMLCALAEGELPNFHLFTKRLALRSTAHFVGELESSGKLTNAKLCFKRIDLATRAGNQEARIQLYGQTKLGFRQLPIERWIATQLYSLRIQAGSDSDRLVRPFEVVIERAAENPEDDAPEALIRSEAMKENLTVIEAVDANGVDVTRKIELKLDTLKSDQGYWLDSGILSVAG